MNNLINPLRYFLPVCLLFTTTFAENNAQNDKIIFLYFKKQHDIITLEKSSVVKGTLHNRFKNTFNGIEYCVTLKTGDEAFCGVVRDPSIIPYDYIDPDEPGKLKGGLLLDNDARFVVRIPYMEGLKNISFYNNNQEGLRGKLLSTIALTPLYNKVTEPSAKISLCDRATIQLVQGDSVDNRVNYCVFSEGYTESELNSGKFINDLKNGINYQFTRTPYKEYKGHFAVWAISVASGSSGAGGYFESTWSGRLLYCQSGGMQKARDLLAELKPNWDMGLILVNSTTYGGAGSQIAVSSINSTYCGQLINHETGHGYAGLGDEYDDPGATPRENPNTTQETDRTQIRWKEWIESSTPIPTPETSSYDNVVGLFEGAAYMPNDWYRPMLKCTMDWLDDPFCKVCTETIIARAYKNVSPADQHTPENLGVHYDDISNKELKIVPLQPTENTVRTVWYVNGENISVNAHTLDLTKITLNQGSNTVTAVVADTTSRIQIPINLPPPRDTITWNVTYGTNAIQTVKPVQNNSYSLSYTASGDIYISFTLHSKREATITLFDSRGRMVERSYNGTIPEGFHKIKLPDVSKLSKGIYFLSCSFDGHNVPRKVQIIK